ncbi:MAG: phage major capsid protein [Planctomycetes bacterium]|nr:phage major capsid protein [Planctomycetota bacterium]
MGAPQDLAKEFRTQFDTFTKTQEERMDDALGKLTALAKSDGEKQALIDAHTKELDVLKTAKEDMEKYAKQLATLQSDDRFQADPSYKGFWPNRKMAGDFGHFVLAEAGHREASAKHLVDAGYKFKSEAGKAISGDDYVKAMAIGTTSAGGALTPDLLIAQIIRNVEMHGVFRQHVLIVPMSQTKQTWPKRIGGFTVYYPDEGVNITPSDLTLANVTLDATRWSVLARYSRELDEDSVISLGELIAQEIALALAKAEDTNGFMGDGTGAFASVTGVFNSPNVAVVVMGAGNTSFDDISDDDLIDMIRAVPDWVRKSGQAAFYVSPDVAGKIEKIRDANGLPLYKRAAEGGPLIVHGFEVREVNVLPGTVDDAVSTKFIAFGSLRDAYMLGQRRAMRLERDNSVFWLSDEIAVKAVPRQTIEEADGNAMAVLSTAAV